MISLQRVLFQEWESNVDRIVVTGLGVVAPNAHGLAEYENSLRNSTSGIRFIEKLDELKFACQVGGIPQNIDSIKHKYFSEEELLAMNDTMIFSGIAGIDCWRDAGLPERNAESEVDWETGGIIGTGIGGMQTIADKLVPQVQKGRVSRLGSTIVEQVMCSAVSAKMAGTLGLGGQVTTNSSACTTGTEAIITAYHILKSGRCKRMIAGGAEGASPYTWAGFDGMKVLNSKHNQDPTRASRPMSASASGFIPGSGAGFLMLETLSSAQERNAHIYAEIIGGQVNCGGHRNGGSMTAPNPEGVIRCIRAAMSMAKITPAEIDAINGHLTATFADPKEIQNWAKALEVSPQNFPLINSTKSLIGHALGAAGGLECVAAILQLHKNFVHASINCDDLHSELKSFEHSIVQQTKEFKGSIIAKSSFGFGDVNGCVLFKKWSKDQN
jgi:3-oxoacyl-(acyl-carrier-protein) synthase